MPQVPSVLSDTSYEHPASKTAGSSSGVSSDVSDSENDHSEQDHSEHDHCGISDPGSPSKGGVWARKNVKIANVQIRKAMLF